MKQIILLLFVSGLCLHSFAQQNNYSKIYPQVLNYYFDPIKATDLGISQISKPVKEKIDTMIVQKEDYFPTELPDFLNNYVILYLSRDEINHYTGRHSMLVMSPVKESETLFSIKLTEYHKGKDLWSSWGYRVYKFAYNSKIKDFELVQPVITFVKF